MNRHDSAQQFEKAGAQAAEVFGRFLSIATEIGKEFNKQGTGFSAADQQRSKEELREFGEQLRQFRESAGYTIDGFARALEQQLTNFDVADTITEVEKGQADLPTHWAEAIARILSNHEVDEFFKRAGNAQPQDNRPQQTRAQTLAAVFDNDPDLDKLTDNEFNKLASHMKAAYLSAKTLIGDQ